MRLFLLYGLLVSNFANALENAPRLEFRSVAISSRNEVTLLAKLIPAIEALSLQVKQGEKLYPLVQGKKIPIHLIVLAENSSSSVREHLEAYLSQVSVALKKSLVSGSLLSFGIYNSRENKVVAKLKKSDEFELPKIQFESSQLSAPYQKMLEAIIENVTFDLPTFVWVFSSGNILLEAKTLEMISKRNLDIEIFNLNSFLTKDLQVMVEKQNRNLKVPHIQVRPFVNTAPIPIGYYQGNFQASVKKEGSENFEISPVIEGKVGPGSLLTLKLGSFVPFYRKTWFLVFAFFIGFSGLFYGLWRLTRPRYCTDCRQPIRNEDIECFFCAKAPQYYLRVKDPVRSCWVPLKKNWLRVGTSFRSHIGLKRFPGECRQPLFEIKMLSAVEGQISLIPKAVLSLKNKKVTTERLIANGDSWVVGGREFSLVRRSYE